MTPQEVAALLAYAARLDPRLAAPSEAEADAQLDQWCDLLSDVPATAPHPDGRAWDASQVVRHHIASSPYPIKPSDVSRPWWAFRRDVLDRHTDAVPAADPDKPLDYRAELLSVRTAVATGQQQATTYRELRGGPAPEVAERLAAIGRRIPPEAAAGLAKWRSRATKRERLAAEGLPDPYTVPCSHCRARAGEACRNHRRKPRTTAHPSRMDAATARHAAQNGAAA